VRVKYTLCKSSLHDFLAHPLIFVYSNFFQIVDTQHRAVLLKFILVKFELILIVLHISKWFYEMILAAIKFYLSQA
jgi:hypothetical protein